MMKPKAHGIETPEPFYKIQFGCSNRAFYVVRSDLFETGKSIGLEPGDGYYTENCDYEGDLEEIVIHRGERGHLLVIAVLKFYGIEAIMPKNMDLHLSIF